LKANADKKNRELSGRFFKKGDEALVYGVRMREVGMIGKDFYKQIKDNTKKEILGL